MKSKIQVQGIDFSCKKFDELTNLELYQILQVRELVFALEQEVFYKDLDDLDQVSYHLTGYKHGELVCYCRIIPPEILNDNSIKIGRVLTPPSKRKNGYGIQLINQAILICKALTNYPIKITAQFYLQKFYQNFGFKTQGDIFMFEGINHINMTLDTSDINIVNPEKAKLYSYLKD